MAPFVSGDAEVVTGLPELDWFPKPFRGGDHDGTGEAKLLGTSNVGLVDVIVRETAQNSWDARERRGVPRFGIHLRQLSYRAMEVLRNEVFRRGTQYLALHDSLKKNGMWVLEVSDRGTHGLNGPIRNDLRYMTGAPTNFVDLVLSVGSPQDKVGGGGTYGFGKTAAFKASEASTVIYWSHSMEQGVIEPRLIASGIGRSFVQEGRRFTGRHWWGRTSDDGERPEPLTGSRADQLASELFAGGFGPAETGTSILILDPAMDVGREGEVIGSVGYMDEVRDAVLENLWPKLVGSDGGRTMEIRLARNGQQIELPDPRTEPVLAPFVECLETVRRAQSNEHVEKEELDLVKLVEVRSQRPMKLLGHLALVRMPVSGRPRDLGFGTEAHHVSLMRNDAELVVKYLPGRELDAAGFQWAGVFKPTAEIDSAFAASEPPTHDEWNSASLRRPASTYVNVGLRRIREQIQEFLTPLVPEPSAGDVVPSVVSLANRLSGFVTTSNSNRATPRTGRARAGGGRGPRKAAPEIVDHLDIRWEGGWRHLAAQIEVRGAGTGVTTVRATAGVLVEGGAREAGEDVVHVLGWSDGPTDDPSSERTMRMVPPGGSRWVHVLCREDLAVDLRVILESE